MRQPRYSVRWIGNGRRTAAGIGMLVFIVMPAQTRQRSLLIIDITRDVQVTVHLDRSVILELDETSGLVHQPKFADRRGGRRVCVREHSPDDYAVFRITLLRENQDLIARRRRAIHAPPGANPRREDR